MGTSGDGCPKGFRTQSLDSCINLRPTSSERMQSMGVVAHGVLRQRVYSDPLVMDYEDEDLTAVRCCQ